MGIQIDTQTKSGLPQRKNGKMKNLVLFIALTIGLSLFQSCSMDRDRSWVNAKAPTIPSLEMMTLPQTAFNTFSEVVEEDRVAGTFENFTHAVFSLLAWNTVVSIQMALPTAAFQAATETDPIAINDTTFEWRYTFDDVENSDIYEIALTAQISDDGNRVLWKMLASQVNGFQDFLWYEGYTTLDRSETSLVLHHKPESPEPYITILFNRDVDEMSIRFTNVIPQALEEGSFIKYEAKEGGGLNRAFRLGESVENDMDIEYNKDLGNGRVRHQKYFGDTNWHCWDADRKDIDCE